MPSPDFTRYIDLTIYDADTQAVFDAAVAKIKETLPEWVPREGNTEVLLLEAMAQEVAEFVYAVNRLPDGILEALLKFYQIERDYGAQPECSVTFYMAGTAGYTIPAGTRFAVNIDELAEPVVFETDTELVVPVGSSEGTVAASGVEYTDRVNGIPAGTNVDLLDAIIYANYATLASTVVNGRSSESDDAYLERGMNRFARLSTTLVLPSHFTAYALENPNVSRAITLDNYDPANDADNNGPVGNDPGHVTVALYGPTGTVSTDVKTALNNEMDASSQANLAAHVIDAAIQTIDITCTVKASIGWGAADVSANVESALATYLDPQTWPWSTVLRYNELIQLISNVEGVDYVVSMSQPAADVTLTGVATLVDLGTASVTVV